MSKQTPVIMVVEDETLLLQAISKKLKLSNLDVISCSSGQQAVDYLNNLDEMPDAVWLDYYLKDMNGLAFMQLLKTNPKWTNIPVLVVSNSASPDKVNNMLALGAKKYILKAEYRLDQIIEIIHEFINQSDNNSSPEKVSVGGVPSQVSPVGATTVVPNTTTFPQAMTSPQLATNNGVQTNRASNTQIQTTAPISSQVKQELPTQ